MSKILTLALGAALSAGIVGCRQDKDRGSMGSMKMNEPTSVNAQPTTMPAATVYTCTMHPEVVSDKPGNCPKCGMALVPKK